MFLFFKDLLAFPVRILVFITMRTKSDKVLSLQKLVWRITGAPEEAVKYLDILYKGYAKTGTPDPRNTAEEMLAGSQSGLFYALAANKDFRLTGSRQWAQDRLQEAEQKELTDPHMLLYPKLAMEQDPEKIKTLAQQIMQRNDYPAYVSSLAYYNLALYYLESDQYEEAEPLISKALLIRESADFRTLAIAHSILTGRGDHEAQEKLLPAHNTGMLHYLKVISYAIARRPELARSSLLQCSDSLLVRAVLNPQIGSLAAEILASRGKPVPNANGDLQ